MGVRRLIAHLNPARVTRPTVYLTKWSSPTTVAIQTGGELVLRGRLVFAPARAGRWDDLERMRADLALFTRAMIR